MIRPASERSGDRYSGVVTAAPGPEGELPVLSRQSSPPGQVPLVGATLWLWRAGVALIHGLIFGPVVVNALFRPAFMAPNLYLWHAARIETAFRTPFEPGEAHFLWPGMSKLVTAVMGVGDVRLGAAIVSVAAYMFLGVCIFEVFRQLDDGPLMPLAAAGASVVIALLETPAALQGWPAIADPETSFLPLYTAFLPTTTASLGFDILLVWFSSRLLMGRLQTSARPWIPVIVVAASLAKPNFVMPLTLAVVALAAWARWKTVRPFGMSLDRDSFGVVVRLLLVPAILVTSIQGLLLQYSNHDSIRGTWVISPLSELRQLGAFGWQFWLVMLFPVFALVLLRTRLLADTAVASGFGALAVSVFAALLLERSYSSYRGDVLQLAQASAAMLVVFILRRCSTLWRERALGRPAMAVLAVVLLPYLAAGASTWVCHAGLVGCYPEVEPPVWPQPRIEGE
ncbi:MAG: hypothetical protein FJW94_05845 [Actinobacteria bacterium]|nr:hypothetical protein [Actinomycetota bacterium]